jgi:4'-phosphopantetheinyl transferase
MTDQGHFAPRVWLALACLTDCPEVVPPWLGAGEREYLKGLTHPKRRAFFLLGRAMLWQALQDLGMAPGELELVRGAHGRPELPMVDISFNLSGSQETVALAVGVGCTVGLDVEDTSRSVDDALIVRRAMADHDRRYIHGLAAHEQRAAFFEIWTLKEAYTKARGMGLKLGFGRFAFDLDVPGRIAWGVPAADDQGTWQIQTFTDGRTLQLALCLAYGGEVVPLIVPHGLVETRHGVLMVPQEATAE